MMMMGDMMGGGEMGMPKMPPGMSMTDLDDLDDDELERIMMGGGKKSKSKGSKKAAS
jgi:hypothetical protein